MRRFCDGTVEHLLERVNALACSRVFIVHEMHPVGTGSVSNSRNDCWHYFTREIGSP